MERLPWFLDPEVLMFGQVAGILVFLAALLFTVARRRFVVLESAIHGVTERLECP